MSAGGSLTPSYSVSFVSGSLNHSLDVNFDSVFVSPIDLVTERMEIADIYF